MNRKQKVSLLAAAIVALTFSVTALADGPAETTSSVGLPGHAGIDDPPRPLVTSYLGWAAPPPGVKTPAGSYVGGNGGNCDYAASPTTGWWRTAIRISAPPSPVP